MDHDKPTGKSAFVFKAISREGHAVTQRVQADSDTAALAQLERLGYRDVQLLDLQDSAIRLDDAHSVLRLKFTAQQEIDLRRQHGLVNRLAWLFARNAWIWGPLVAWLVWAIARYGAGAQQALWPCLALIAFFLRFCWAVVPTVLYNRALEASVWCRWSEVLRIMDALATWKKWFRKTPFPEHELLFRSAIALAGMDQLSAAMVRVAPMERDASLRPGFYAARCASIFAAARDYNRVAQCQRQAHVLAPSTGTAIDLATTLARRLNGADEASALLDGVDVAQLAPAAQVFAYYARGIIAINQANPRGALDWLTRSLTIAQANVGSPLMTGIILDARAHCALALAALGDRDAARLEFDAARAMLQARRDQEMLLRCESALAVQ